MPSPVVIIVSAKHPTLIIPLEAILAYIDGATEREKAGTDLADLPVVDRGAKIPLYAPKTARDWYCLIGLCQRLAERETAIAAIAGREYVRLKIDDSIIRIRVGKYIDVTDPAAKDEKTYYVSYEGEIGKPRNSKVAPTYPVVASQMRALMDVAIARGGASVSDDMRAILRGEKPTRDSVELKTAAVAAFLAEGARNARAFTLNLMVLDLACTSKLTLDRMFWWRDEDQMPPGTDKGTKGGLMPQSGASGADVKALKVKHVLEKVSVATMPFEQASVPGLTMLKEVLKWHNITKDRKNDVYASPSKAFESHVPAVKRPVFMLSPSYDDAKATRNALSQIALDKELWVIQLWVGRLKLYPVCASYNEALAITGPRNIYVTDFSVLIPHLDKSAANVFGSASAMEIQSQMRAASWTINDLREMIESRIMGLDYLLG